MSRVANSDTAWLRDVAPYQDVVLAGETALAGRRDGAGRWELIAPHVPRAATILDIGSNFGWFGLQACDESPERVVASVEADEHSALVQRRVLESHQHQRICMLTARAGVGLARRFAQAGQRFDAVFCLNVLHWIRDHRAMLSELAAISDRVFIEQPDPRETGAGVERLRLEIGPIGEYLAELFPDRPRVLLGRLPSHRECPYPRELWMVAPRGTGSLSEAVRVDHHGTPTMLQKANLSPLTGLDVEALMDLSPTWPPRSWWREQMETATVLAGKPPVAPLAPAARLLGSSRAASHTAWHFTPRGLAWSNVEAQHSADVARLSRRLRCVPETGLFTRRERLRRTLRRAGGRLLRALHLRS